MIAARPTPHRLPQSAAPPWPRSRRALLLATAVATMLALVAPAVEHLAPVLQAGA